MRYVTFEVPSPVGPIERVGVLGASGSVIDINLAARQYYADRVGRRRGTAIADALVPADLIALLANLEVGQDALHRVLDDLPIEVGRTDEQGGTLVHALDSVRLFAPIPRPASIRDCSAYEQHVAAASRGSVPKRWYDFPTYYKGNPFAVLGPDTVVPVPDDSEKCDYELEYAAVIGRSGRDLSPEQALDHIAGYLIFNDVSVRDVQFREMSVGLGPAKSKDFDGSNLFGPALVTPDEWDPHVHHTMQAFVDDEEWSSGSTTTIHFPVEEIVAHISQRETLRVGDIIGTGTVGGGCGLELGKYPPRGSRVELRIEGLGSLANTWGDSPGER